MALKWKSRAAKFELVPRRGMSKVRVLLNRWLKLDRWFPHIPLGIAVAGMGLLRIAPALRQVVGSSAYLKEILNAEGILTLTSMRGLPQVVPGLFLLTMSVGLLQRSQFAWFITILFLTAGMGLEVLSRWPHLHGSQFLLDLMLLAALVLWRRRFRRSSLAAATLFSLASLVTVLGYALVGTMILGSGFAPPVKDVETALYFVLVTMSTVGYGDILPKTAEARLFVISIIVFGITAFATSLSAILMPLINKRMTRLLTTRESGMERTSHFVIVGDSALCRNAYHELRNRGEVVTVVLPETPEESIFRPEDVVIGDGSDLEVLKKATADEAKAVLALGDNDSENAFVVLAAKELEGKPMTVVGVSHSANLSRIRRVKPDMVISPQVLGGEILAMALRGEKIDGELFLKRLFPDHE